MPLVCYSFPEIQFYHSEEVRELMTNILFCYCRDNTDLSYRQVCVLLTDDIHYTITDFR